MSIGLVRQGPAHVIVLGNEKGGSGKSTTAMHLIVALLKAGHRVASVDTDSRQRSLTRYIENRARWAREHGLALEMPVHFIARLAAGETVRDIEAEEFANYAEIMDRIENDFDFVVVDTPGNDSFLMRLSHALADTLITPINDSFVDLDIFGHVDSTTYAVDAVSHYAELVQTARRQRQEVDGVQMNWVVVRNRMSTLVSRNQRNLLVALEDLSSILDFHVGSGIRERVVFRQLFPAGLTVFDRLDRRTHGIEPTLSHLAARNEIRGLIEILDLGPSQPKAASYPAPDTVAVPARRLEPVE